MFRRCSFPSSVVIKLLTIPGTGSCPLSYPCLVLLSGSLYVRLFVEEFDRLEKDDQKEEAFVINLDLLSAGYWRFCSSNSSEILTLG